MLTRLKLRSENREASRAVMLRPLVDTVKVLPGHVLVMPARHWINGSEAEDEKLTSTGEYYASDECCIACTPTRLG
jgi:hypothetical protein